MRSPLHLLSVAILVSFLVGCDSGSGSTTPSGTNSDLVGVWKETYKGGTIKDRNSVLTLKADGSYTDTQNPPDSVYSIFVDERGTWSTSKDTLKVVPTFRRTSSDGARWDTLVASPASVRFVLAGDKLTLLGTNLDDGSVHYVYYVR